MNDVLMCVTFLFFCFVEAQANVTIVQLIDNYSSHKWHLDCVEKYKERHNTTLIRRFLPVMPNRVDALLRKPIELRAVLSSLARDAWLLYLDWDVCVMRQEISPSEFLSTVLKASHKRSSLECHFVAQDAAHTVNAGVLLFRNSAIGRAILDRWIAHVGLRKKILSRLPSHDPLGDQRALTNFLMEAAWRARQGSKLTTTKWRAAFTSNSSYCFGLQDAHRSNLCFEDYMNNLGYPLNHREFGGVCLISEHRLRFNMHDCGQRYETGDIFYHGHSELSH
jgi:hypothetical protein